MLLFVKRNCVGQELPFSSRSGLVSDPPSLDVMACQASAALSWHVAKADVYVVLFRRMKSIVLLAYLQEFIDRESLCGIAVSSCYRRRLEQ